MEPLVELTQSINWNKLFQGAFTAPPGEGGFGYIPIPPVEFELNSHCFVIGCKNGGAPDRWRLGAWLQILAPAINTGSTTQLNDLVEIQRVTLTLRSRHLIRVPAYGVPPYKIRLSFPKWHQAMFIEAWWFDDDRYDVVQEMLKEINSKL